MHLQHANIAHINNSGNKKRRQKGHSSMRTKNIHPTVSHCNHQLEEKSSKSSSKMATTTLTTSTPLQKIQRIMKSIHIQIITDYDNRKRNQILDTAAPDIHTVTAECSILFYTWWLLAHKVHKPLLEDDKISPVTHPCLGCRHFTHNTVHLFHCLVRVEPLMFRWLQLLGRVVLSPPFLGYGWGRHQPTIK